MQATAHAKKHAAARPQGCTNAKLRRFTRQLGRFYDQRMAECGLKTTQYSLLATLARLEPVQPADLARALSMAPSTLTRNLQPLVNAGWVSIDPGPDARSHLLALTAVGRAKRDEAGSVWKSTQQAMNRALGGERVAQLHALVDECRAALEQLDRDEEPSR